MFDVGGRLVLTDAFSVTLNDALAKAGQTERAFEDVGKAADDMAAPDMSGFAAQIDDMVARGASLQEALAAQKLELDTAEAEQGLESVQERIAGLEDTLAKARAMAAGGAVITPEGLQAYKQAESELAGLKSGLAQMTGESDKAGMSIGDLVKGISGLAIGGFAVKQIIGTAYELTQLGAAAIDTEKAFNALASAKGVNADELLGGLTEAAHGAVDDSDLMLAANRAMLLGGEELADKLPDLFNAARASAMLTGRDASSAFEGIVQAIANGNERALKSQGIYVDLAAATKSWATENDRTVESITAVEKRQIAANAVIEAAGPLIRELGLSSATASEQMKSLPVAVDELKESLGELLAQGGAVDLISGITKALQGAAGQMDLGQNLVDVRDTLKEIGDSGALAKFDEEYAKIINRKGPANLLGFKDEEVAAFQAKMSADIAALIQSYEGLAEAQQQSANPELAAAHAYEATQADLAAAATSSYQAALDELNASLSGTAALEKQFAEAVVAGNASLAIIPAMPDISAAMDTGALRAWGDAWAAINPNLTEARASLEATAVSIDAHQRAVLSDALAIDNMDARLQFLTTSLFGSGASINDLIGALDGMPPELLASIGPADDLAVSLARLKAQADQGISIIVTMQGVGQVANDIEGMAVRLSKLYGADNARKWYDAAIDQNEQYWQTVGPQDKLGMEMAAAAIGGTLDSAVSEAERSFGRIQSSAETAFDGIAASAGELQGKIESALNVGLAVTAKDMADTLAGTYEDAPLEAARRLDAIAARGFAELQAHPDWAGLLKIPPDVLSGNEAALKDWAAGTSSDVKNLLRPDLIDWNAFIGDFQHKLDDEAAKKLTIDIAVDKLDAAGLLTGSKEERRKKVAEMLGIEAPEMTIDALFKTSPTARTDMINEVTGGTGVVTFDAVMKFTGGAADAAAPDAAVPKGAALPADPGYDRWMKATQEAIDAAPPIDMSKMVNVEASSEQIAASGARVAEIMSKGATDSIDMAGAVAMTASSITLGAKTFEKELMASGGAIWGKVLAGIDEAVDKSSPDIVNRLADKIAPSVAAILARDSRRTGGP